MKSVIFFTALLFFGSQVVLADDYKSSYDDANRSLRTGSSISKSKLGQQQNADPRAVYGGQKPVTEPSYGGSSNSGGNSGGGNHCPSDRPWMNTDGTCHKI